MEKRIVSTDAAPKAIGPYSQAVTVGDFVYTSGQIAINPKSGEVEYGSIAEQTKLVLENLSAVLSAAGASMQTVVKTTVYLKSMDDFGEMNGVFSEFFGSEPPTRACVQVARLPKDVLVEIDAVAYKADSK
ncbi:MAG: RidA family protein [Clostridia bacterium]|jgi:2-iminobutanoate/2-iminopropanoate deaminase|nr:RidA family protein [Clostridia bacterium]MBT7122057.1 RidA family protein [Clostridia bacterium]